MAERVRYRVRDDSFEVIGRGRFSESRFGDVVLPIDLLRNASLTDLANALRRRREHTRDRRVQTDEIFFSKVPWEDFDPDTSQKANPLPMLDPFNPGRFGVSVGFYAYDGRESSEVELRDLVAPVLERHRALWDGVWTDDDHGLGWS